MMNLFRDRPGRLTASARPVLIWSIAGFVLVAILFMVIARSRSSSTAANSAKTSAIVARSNAVAAVQYHKAIKPMLEKFCFDCHGDGMKKGNMSLDEFKDDADMLAQKGHWLSVMKNIRAGVMPPPGKSKLTEAEQQQLADWIKYGAFGIDRNNPDPGRVTIHRLNRLEYRNTISQLLGVDYNTDDEFPPDGAGLGLDNIADLLTMSPLVLEKYLKAAEVVLDGSFPSEKGREFSVPGSAIRGNNNATGERLAFGGTPEVVFAYRNKFPGAFHVVLEMEVAGEGSVTNTCHFVVSEQSGTAPKEVLLEREFTGKPETFEFAFDRVWSLEPHVFKINVTSPGGRPAGGGGGRGQTPPTGPFLKITNLRVAAQPTAEAKRYFAKDTPPTVANDLRDYIRQGVAAFGLHAFRRPIDDRTRDRLADEIQQRFRETGLFADSVKPSLAKVLCSPRFLFRATQTAPTKPNEPWSPIDEYSLASRLSYFLWSSMPDDELLNLAARGELRKNLDAQIKRMLSHKFASRMVENFSGQWLQTRNVMKWTIVEPEVLKREGKTAGKPLLTDDIRRSMKEETTMFFGRIVKEDRSILDVIDSDYTYLNEGLAAYYGVAGVTGPEMQLVTLPKDSPRGGVMTQGSMLLVTSGANRTSAVKRGVFVLDNILGLRPHDPPPDVPGIEQASNKIKDHEPTFRESLELHRKDPLCASCHNLMDPIGFGLDNFNAMGLYRETEYGQPIDATGKLASGEEFKGAGELKQILKTNHRKDFYRCLTEKLMNYAVGRGMEYYDTESVDRIVERLERENGRFSALLMGIIESAPFQQRRNGSTAGIVADSNTAPAANEARQPLQEKTL